MKKLLARLFNFVRLDKALDFNRTALIADHEEVASQHQQKRHENFEAAILSWEQRTGQVVERNGSGGTTFTDNFGRKHVVFSSKEWKNFSMFLGSREACQYRKENAMDYGEMIKEWDDLRIPDNMVVKEIEDE